MKTTPSTSVTPSKGKQPGKPSGNNNPKSAKKSVSGGESSEPHFCSSAFLNSPEPSSLPIPVFDDEDTKRVSGSSDSSGPGLKTNALRQFLNIRTTPPSSPIITVKT